ncbi:MAG TPA: hypothetical protein VFE24_08245 [Pirellulales bacterium]|nr:hypothetical protein [Pirellulales bacterium]
MKTRLLSLFALVTLFACSGATCARYPAPPQILQASPTLEQIELAVNTNSAHVLSLDAPNASLSGTGFPTLRTSLAFDRPRRIRMRAETGFTGPEVDLGSNDELFWFWVKRSTPPALYFCRHDQLAISNFRQIMPVEPEWLIEALGVTTFDPAVTSQGPFPVHGGRLEIRSPRSSAAGNFTKITVVDEKTAIVLEQHLYDAKGTRIATAMTSNPRYFPEYQASMPQQVDIEWPANQVHLHLDLNDYQLNTLHNVPSPLWQKPEYPGFANVDLARPNGFSGPVVEPPLAKSVLPASANLPLTPEANPGPTPSAKPETPTEVFVPKAVLSPIVGEK